MTINEAKILCCGVKVIDAHLITMNSSVKYLCTFALFSILSCAYDLFDIMKEKG